MLSRCNKCLAHDMCTAQFSLWKIFLPLSSFYHSSIIWLLYTIIICGCDSDIISNDSPTSQKKLMMPKKLQLCLKSLLGSIHCKPINPQKTHKFFCCKGQKICQICWARYSSWYLWRVYFRRKLCVCYRNSFVES